MTNSKSNRRLVNMGSVNGLVVTMDVTSYSANGELVSASGLGIAADPFALFVLSSEKMLGHQWDKTNKKLKLFYPHGATIKHNAAPAATTARLTAAPEQLEQTLAGAADVKIGDEGKELTAADDGGTLEILALYEGA